MKISIVTVCFNSEGTVEQTINSVLSQDYPDIEYIVIDGKSTDSTVGIINKYEKQLSKFVSEPDSGIYDAMNKGVKLASGDVIGILNSDDIFADSSVVSEVAKQFSIDPSASIVFGNLIFKDFDNGRTLRYYAANRFKPYKLRFGWMPPHPATFVKRSLYEKFGHYRTDMQISADYEKFVKWLLVEKEPYKHFDRVLVHMRTGGASTSGFQSIYQLNKEIVIACKLNGVYTNMLLLIFKMPFKIAELFKRV